LERSIAKEAKVEYSETLAREARIRFGKAGADRIAKAMRLAARAHKGQKRPDGGHYLDHPMQIALRMLECGISDPNLIIAALLHDTVEDGWKKIAKSEEEAFLLIGDEFSRLVARTVFKLTNLNLGGDTDAYFKKIEKLSTDFSAFTVKVFDLEHNLSTLDNLKDEEKRERLKRKYKRVIKYIVLPKIRAIRGNHPLHICKSELILIFENIG
jgi:GTP diphosphokinase / guanosine-3',5'-bis(diphosphate) 3'-diphosphatase